MGLVLVLCILTAGLILWRTRRPHSPAVRSGSPSSSSNAIGVQFCRKPWFNPYSDNDWKTTTYDSKKPFVEVDSIEGLMTAMKPEFKPYNSFVIFQQWGPEDKDGNRAYSWLSRPATEQLARALAAGDVRSIILLCTTFEPGAIRAFADTLASLRKPDDGSVLEMLGLFWYFSGDTVVDSPELLDEAAYAVNKLGLSRLSLLSGEFDAECERRLLHSLEGNTKLQWLGVFGKDEAMSWPAFKTPGLAALADANRKPSPR
ncbi:MAG: hypothetical protein GX410_03845 [Elusimicrobia bacterium]|nr:hypothetical protein [Elusimicrobiota bacterium]